MEDYLFKLFVIENSPECAHAIKNINFILEKYLKGKSKLEIIDISKQSNIAKEENIFMVPLLIKKFPLPEERFIGDLSDSKKILAIL